MKSRSVTHDSNAEEQAALWAARLDGSSLGSADREALEAWLSSDPAHRALLSQYCQFSADLETQLAALAAQGRVQLPVVAQPRRQFLWSATYAGIALAAGAVAIVVWINRPAQSQSIATAVAQRQLVTLPEGTRVELNARTTLRVELSGSERRVHLAQGQAFFHVTKDAERPFVVETPAGSVRVTGTAFDVRAGGEAELHVVVQEGSVLVRPAEVGNQKPVSPLTLRAGEQLSAVAGVVSRRTLDAEQLDDLLAWREGLVVFDAVPLNIALAQFAHHHGRGINVLPGAAAHRVSGRYSLDDLDGFIRGLDQAFPVEVVRSQSGTITVAPRRER